MRPTAYTKRQLALTSIEKGCAFYFASLSLRHLSAIEPYKYVELHLLCQSIELVLKGILLLYDYDFYKPSMKRYGHDLKELADEAAKLYKVRPLLSKAESELIQLNKFYKNHHLRYAGITDILISPKSIDLKFVCARFRALLKVYAIKKNNL